MIGISSTSMTSASGILFVVSEGLLFRNARGDVDVVSPFPADFVAVVVIADVDFASDVPLEGEAVVDFAVTTADERVTFDDEATDLGVSVTVVLPVNN